MKVDLQHTCLLQEMLLLVKVHSMLTVFLWETLDMMVAEVLWFFQRYYRRDTLFCAV